MNLSNRARVCDYSTGIFSFFVVRVWRCEQFPYPVAFVDFFFYISNGFDKTHMIIALIYNSSLIG